MVIRFKCPKCSKVLSAKDENAEKKGRCSCGAIIVVPSASTLTQKGKRETTTQTVGTDSRSGDKVGEYAQGFVDRKRFEDFQPFIKLEVGENVFFFAKSTTTSPVDSGLAGVVKPYLYLAVTNKRIIAIAKDKKNNVYIDSAAIDKVRWIEFRKKLLTNAIEIVICDPDERLLRLEFAANVKAEKLKEMIEYSKTLRGGFKEPETPILSRQLKEQRKEEVRKQRGVVLIDYVGGHPDRTKSYQSGSLEIYDDKLQYITAFKREVLFVIAHRDVANVEQYTEGEIKKKFSAGKAIAGGLLFGALGAAGGFLLGKEKDARNFFLKIDAKYSGQDIEVFLSGKQKNVQQSLNTIKGALVCSRAETTSTAQSDNHTNVSNKIRELAKLKEEGLITEAEFEAKKKQILGL